MWPHSWCRDHACGTKPVIPFRQRPGRPPISPFLPLPPRPRRPLSSNRTPSKPTRAHHCATDPLASLHSLHFTMYASLAPRTPQCRAPPMLGRWDTSPASLDPIPCAPLCPSSAENTSPVSRPSLVCLLPRTPSLAAVDFALLLLSPSAVPRTPPPYRATPTPCTWWRAQRAPSGRQTTGERGHTVHLNTCARCTSSWLGGVLTALSTPGFCTCSCAVTNPLPGHRIPATALTSVLPRAQPPATPSLAFLGLALTLTLALCLT